MRRHKRRPDAVARAVTLAVASGRIGIGIGAMFATRPALRALGFPETDSSGRALAKLAGGRDIALGALALAAHDDQEALRTACLAGVAVDAVDAISLGTAAIRGEDLDRAGIVGALSGAAAAVAGTWAANRLAQDSQNP